MHTCGGCTATWTGTRKAHCSGCHTTWATVRLFDRHRCAEGEHGSCVDPTSLVDGAGRPKVVLRDGVWGGPERTEAQKEALARMWAERKSGQDGRK